MPPLAEVRAANATWAPSYHPVAVFVGGTSGIGEGIVQAFARHTKGNAHLFIVGRNEAAAKRIFTRIDQPTDQTTTFVREFLHCDLSFIANAKRTAAAIQARFPTGVNFLFMSAGELSLAGLTITPEGVDRQLAQIYYSKWAFIDGLLPALRAAREAGQDARVAAIHTAIRGGPIDLDDLGLVKVSSGGLRNIAKAIPQLASYQDLMAEGFAAHDSTGITFTHTFPGAVDTPLLAKSPSLVLRIMYRFRWVLNPFFMLRTKSISDAGECQLYGLLQAPAGASRYGGDGEDIGMGGVGDPTWDEARERLWEHSEKIVNDVVG
uniref:NAD(P)-binding protein n=1 Tax=Mycena chlorophos TaxID=658473 RepID=A0ABQ0KZQ6_MYCCL|nr:predicted protein [Mycena chlorophos]